jgi:hypothetical protein
MKTQTQTRRANLHIVGKVTGDSLLGLALEAYQAEANSIDNPAPIGMWLVRPAKRSPQLRWECGVDRRGNPKQRSQSISVAEAAGWPERERQREQKRKLNSKINAIITILDQQ